MTTANEMPDDVDGAEDHKAVERAYYARIGSDGMAHALRKPFADSSRSQLLLEFGAVLSLLPPPPGRILDFGCGVGWTTDFLARSGYDATGLDLSPEAIEAAREAHGNRAAFYVHDYETPLVRHEPYDFALFFDALHHCTDVDAALRCAAEALRPGGVCVVAEPGRGHASASGSVNAHESYGVTERDMPPDVVLAAAHRAGFRHGTAYAQPAEVKNLLYEKQQRTGLRRLLDTRPGHWLLMVRAMDFSRRRGGLVRLER